MHWWEEEEHRRHEPGRRWRRRGWVTHERYLLDVVERHLFNDLADWAALLPRSLPSPFTTADLGNALGVRRAVAQKMAYCLRKVALITPVGKQANAILYRREEPHGV